MFKSKKRSISSQIDQSGGFILLATLLGAIICGFFIFQSDFPVNDGGMFYTMIKDLEVNSFKLPIYTSYNNATIPYAYPPFSFYLAGLLHTFLKIDILQLLRFIPYCFTVLSIPAFYLLSTQLINKKNQQILATFLFALIPSSYTWQIMGGGITRSPAFFFTMLALFFFLRLEKDKNKKDLICVTLFSSLTALSHLEMLWMLGISYLLIFLFFNCSLKGLRDLGIIALGVLVLTSVWWLPVLMYHGITPFVSAMSTGGFNLWVPFAFIISMNAFSNLSMSFVVFLAIIGIFLFIKKSNWFLFVWLMVFIFFDPRSNQRSAAIPMAIFAAVALEVMFTWVVQNYPKSTQIQNDDKLASVFLNTKVKTIFCIILFYAIFNNLYALYAGGSSLGVLNSDNRSAMKWVSQNTNGESKFLVLDFPIGWHSDMVAEWFPALTGRTSIITAQGLEWLPGRANATIKELSQVSNCRFNGVKCLEGWEQNGEYEFEYIYFTSNSQGFYDPPKFASSIDAEMSHLNDYQLVYSNSDVRIYKNK